jgi:hypothetical protein
MSSASVGTRRRSRPRLRHPAEVPFFIFMVVLNSLVIAATLDLGPVRRTMSPPPAGRGWPPGPGPPGRVAVHVDGPEPLRAAGMHRRPMAADFHKGSPSWFK